MYNEPYDSQGEDLERLEACGEPGYGALHGELEWDAGNIGHVDSRARITWQAVVAGLEAGYFYLGPDPEHECRHQFLFRVAAPLERVLPAPLAVYRLIVDTTRATLRPVTWFEETKESNIRKFKAEDKRGELE